jgi:hypothetical protein
MKRIVRVLWLSAVLALGGVAPPVTVAVAQLNTFDLTIELRSDPVTKEDPPPNIEEGGPLFIRMTITNKTGGANAFYKIRISYRPPGITDFSPPLPLSALQCTFGTRVQTGTPPPEPTAEPENCEQLASDTPTPTGKREFFSLDQGFTQLLVIRFDTSPFVSPSAGSLFFGHPLRATALVRLKADLVEPKPDAENPQPLTDPARTQDREKDFNLVSSTAQLQILAPIELVPAAPPQGSLPTLSFLVATTATSKGGFRDKETAVYFRIELQGAPLPFSDLTPLIASAEACDFLPAGPGQSGPTIENCELMPDRQRLPAIGAGRIKQVRLVFLTALLAPGSYRIFGCLKRVANIAPQCVAGQAINPSDGFFDAFAVNFQIAPAVGHLVLALESPGEIQEGQDTALVFLLSNATRVIQQTVTLSFELNPPPPAAQPRLLECLELLPGGGTRNILKENQCVLTNLAPTTSDAADARRFRVKLPTRSYQRAQTPAVTLLVRDGGGLLRKDMSSLVLPVVVTPTALVDGPELHPISIQFSPPSPVPQGQIVVIRSRIQNTGTRASGAFTVTFQLIRESSAGQGTVIAVLGEPRRFPGIDKGATIEASALLDTCAKGNATQCTLTPGTYLIKVMVSPLPDELDKSNNELAARLTIVEPRGF